MSVTAVVVVATVVTVGCVVSTVESIVVVLVGLRKAEYTSATRGGGVIWADDDWLADSEV